MSKYPGESASSCNADSFLLVSNSKEGPRIANVVKITKSNQTLKQIDITQDNKQMKLTLKLIDTKLVDGKLFRKGTTSGESIKCVGEN